MLFIVQLGISCIGIAIERVVKQVKGRRNLTSLIETAGLFNNMVVTFSVEIFLACSSVTNSEALTSPTEFNADVPFVVISICPCTVATEAELAEFPAITVGNQKFSVTRKYTAAEPKISVSRASVAIEHTTPPG